MKHVQRIQIAVSIFSSPLCGGDLELGIGHSADTATSSRCSPGERPTRGTSPRSVPPYQARSSWKLQSSDCFRVAFRPFRHSVLIRTAVRIPSMVHIYEEAPEGNCSSFEPQVRIRGEAASSCLPPLRGHRAPRSMPSYPKPPRGETASSRLRPPQRRRVSGVGHSADTAQRPTRGKSPRSALLVIHRDIVPVLSRGASRSIPKGPPSGGQPPRGETAFAEHPLVGPAVFARPRDCEAHCPRSSPMRGSRRDMSLWGRLLRRDTRHRPGVLPGSVPPVGRVPRSKHPPLPSPPGSPPCRWGFNCGLMAKSPRFHMTLGMANTLNKRYTFSRRLIAPFIPLRMDRSSFFYRFDLSFSFGEPIHTRRSAWQVLITSAVAIL